jgi:hypothetical protein
MGCHEGWDEIHGLNAVESEGLDHLLLYQNVIRIVSILQRLTKNGVHLESQVPYDNTTDP